MEVSTPKQNINITKIKAAKKPTGVRRVNIPKANSVVYPPDYELHKGTPSDPIPGELELDLSGQIFKKYLMN